MTKISIKALALQQLQASVGAGGQRAAHTVYGGHEKSLRQTVIGMLRGASLGEHDNHDDATVYVLQGRIQLRIGVDVWNARAGSLLIVPHERHSFEALEDSAVLMSVAKRPYPSGKF